MSAKCLLYSVNLEWFYLVVLWIDFSQKEWNFLNQIMHEIF